jgi:hypothetical protein
MTYKNSIQFFCQTLKSILHLKFVLDGTSRSWVGFPTMVFYIDLRIFFDVIKIPQLVDRTLPKF